MTAVDWTLRCAALPIFPLPGAVLMPGALLPLHVFEPRYQALVAHALASDGVIGLSTLIAADSGSMWPPIHPEIGVGTILRHQALDDGRSNILLRYEASALYVRDLPVDTPYRCVESVALPPVPDVGYAPDPALRMLALQVATGAGPLGPQERLFALEGRTWVDAMAGMFLPDEEARRAYLVAGSGPARVAAVREALLGWLAEAAPVSHES